VRRSQRDGRDHPQRERRAQRPERDGVAVAPGREDGDRDRRLVVALAVRAGPEALGPAGELLDDFGREPGGHSDTFLSMKERAASR